MNMICASTYLYLLQFLSSVSCNFMSTGLWFGLFLGILFLLKQLQMGFFSLVSLSVSSLLAYKNATNFWILILCPTTLLNSFISFTRFLVEPLGFSMYSIMLFTNTDSFTSSFSIWMPFISSSCLIALDRTSSTILNKRGESRHPCLVSHLKGNSCYFCLLNMMLAMGLSYGLYYVEVCFLLLRVCTINRCWILSNAFLYLLM